MSNHAHAINELFQRQRRDLTLLIATLTDEHAALAGNDVALLEATTAAKQGQLLAIEQGMRDQVQLLQAAGVTLDDHGITTYLRQCDPQGRLALAANWRQIKELLDRCREQNLVNGRIVSMNQRHALRALTILRGGSPGNGDCYGRSGQTANGLAPRSLGKV